MNNWTIRQRIVVSFTAIVLLIAGAGVIAHFRLAAIEREAKTVETDSLLGLFYIAQLRGNTVRGYALSLEYILQEEKTARDVLSSQFQVNRAFLEKLVKQY